MGRSKTAGAPATLSELAPPSITTAQTSSPPPPGVWQYIQVTNRQSGASSCTGSFKGPGGDDDNKNGAESLQVTGFLRCDHRDELPVVEIEWLSGHIRSVVNGSKW